MAGMDTPRTERDADGNEYVVTGPKDTGGNSFMGMTTGGKYVPLGRLHEAQADEDRRDDAVGDEMRDDVAAAAHPAPGPSKP